MTTINTDNEQGEALKPCPFCGSASVVWSEHFQRVRCNGCFIGTNTVIEPRMPETHKERCIRDWNTRRASLAAVEGDAVHPLTKAIRAQSPHEFEGGSKSLPCSRCDLIYSASIHHTAAASSPAPVSPAERDSRICTRAFPCRYRDPRQCAHDTKLGDECPKVCECACHAPAQPEGEQVIRKKRARRIIDVVIGSPCIVETRFFSQPEEQEKLENQVAAILGQLEREQLENEIFQDATDPAWTPPDTPVVAREVIELFRDTAMKAHVLAVHKCGFEECEWAECEERKKMINELDAATTPPSETAVGGEGLTDLQRAVIEHDDDMARLDRNTVPAQIVQSPTTIQRIDAAIRFSVPMPQQEKLRALINMLIIEYAQQRETLVYWLLRAYQSGHREGWEPGPNTDETMDGILDTLANAGYDPKSEKAKEILADETRRRH